MGIGTDLKKAIATAKKAGCDISWLGGFEGICRGFDELEKHWKYCSDKAKILD